MKMKYTIAALGVVIVPAGELFSIPAADAQQQSRPPEGICVLMPTEGSHVTGTISLLEEGDSLHIAGEVRHLKPGRHAFHVHEFGDLRAPDASTCGAPYNSGQQPESSRKTNSPAGDLGNIEADAQGIALVNIMAPQLKIRSILGRSLVVHANADDLHGQAGADSAAANPRVAAGVIGYRHIDIGP